MWCAFQGQKFITEKNFTKEFTRDDGRGLLIEFAANEYFEAVVEITGWQVSMKVDDSGEDHEYVVVNESKTGEQKKIPILIT